MTGRLYRIKNDDIFYVLWYYIIYIPFDIIFIMAQVGNLTKF